MYEILIPVYVLYCAVTVVTGFTIQDTSGFMFNDIRDNTLVELLSKLLLHPYYLFLLAVFTLFSPILVPILLYENVKSIKIFFDKKPLSFLKDYSIEFKRKEK